MHQSCRTASWSGPGQMRRLFRSAGVSRRRRKSNPAPVISASEAQQDKAGHGSGAAVRCGRRSGQVGAIRSSFGLDPGLTLERFRTKWIPARIAIKLRADCLALSAVENASKPEAGALVLIQSEPIMLWRHGRPAGFLVGLADGLADIAEHFPGLGDQGAGLYQELSISSRSEITVGGSSPPYLSLSKDRQESSGVLVSAPSTVLMPESAGVDDAGDPFSIARQRRRKRLEVVQVSFTASSLSAMILSTRCAAPPDFPGC